MGVVRRRDLVRFVYQPLEKKVTYLCVVRLLLDSTTALEGLLPSNHLSVIGGQQQHPNVADV